MRQDDIVVVMASSRYLFVLRPVEYGYRVIGPAYIYGLMAGGTGDEQVAHGMEEKVFRVR